MSVKLVAYEYVSSGFEMVIVKNEVKVWNLWWSIQLTDDPEAGDEEVREVNRRQRKRRAYKSHSEG